MKQALARSILWPANTITIDGMQWQHPDIYGISFDTRTLQPGDVFFALKDVRDGHTYVQQAINKGAACAIVERKICENNIVVNSPLNALVKLAQLRRSMFKGTVIGITGSVGKTTSKVMIAKALEAAGKKVFATEKSFNNLLGLSYSLAQLPLDAEFAIMEIGMSNPGEIAPLAKLCDLDYSLITKIAPAHIESFDTFKDIAIEKGQIIKHTKKCTVFDANAWSANIFTKIANEVANETGCAIKHFYSTDDAMQSLQAAWKVILELLGVAKPMFKTSDLNNIAGRRNIFNYNGATIIDSAYNANLTSMIENLKFLNTFDGEKTAILGDMLCIGERSARYHEMLLCYVRDVKLLCVGEHMKLLAQKYNAVRYNTAGHADAIWFESVAKLIEYLKNAELTGTVLIKGSSNSHKSANDLAAVVEFFQS